MLLGRGASVGRMAVDVKTALVTDADTVGVVTLGMGSYHFLWTTWIDSAILGDVVIFLKSPRL